MKFLVMIYSDDQLLDALPAGQFDHMMRGCLAHADELKAEGCLIASQQLEHPATARSVRVRDGKTAVFDGPFAEQPVGLWWSRREFGCVRTDFRRFAGP